MTSDGQAQLYRQRGVSVVFVDRMAALLSMKRKLIQPSKDPRSINHRISADVPHDPHHPRYIGSIACSWSEQAPLPHTTPVDQGSPNNSLTLEQSPHSDHARQFAKPCATHPVADSVGDGPAPPQLNFTCSRWAKRKRFHITVFIPLKVTIELHAVQAKPKISRPMHKGEGWPATAHQSPTSPTPIIPGIVGT